MKGKYEEAICKEEIWGNTYTFTFFFISVLPMTKTQLHGL